MSETPQIALESVAALPYLYLTTTGRTTGLPREIEIWFVTFDGRLYILAEHGQAAQWVKNIQRAPDVHVRVGDDNLAAVGRVLDRVADADRWQRAQALMRDKYGWGAGLPVELTPSAAP